MNDSIDKFRRLLDWIYNLMIDESSLHFSDFADVADSFVKSYARMVGLGASERAIGLAMLGATVNMYSLFGMEEELPDILRMMADKLEQDRNFH